MWARSLLSSPSSPPPPGPSGAPPGCTSSSTSRGSPARSGRTEWTNNSLLHPVDSLMVQWVLGEMHHKGRIQSKIKNSLKISKPCPWGMTPPNESLFMVISLQLHSILNSMFSPYKSPSVCWLTWLVQECDNSRNTLFSICQ